MQAAIYEGKLQSSSYDGESQRFTYDKYCDIHQLAHTRLQALVGNGYHGIDEGTKIRHFLAGIKTDKLKTAVELVRGNPDFPTYELVARRIKDSVVTLKPIKASDRRRPDRNISTVKDKDLPYPDVEADMSVEDKFYTDEQWKAMSKSKKKGVLKKRKQRNIKTKKPTKGKEPAEKEPRYVKALKKSFEALSRKVSSIERTSDSEDGHSSGNESSDSDQSTKQKEKKRPKTSGNRVHFATSRDKKKKSKK